MTHVTDWEAFHEPSAASQYAYRRAQLQHFIDDYRMSDPAAISARIKFIEDRLAGKTTGTAVAQTELAPVGGHLSADDAAALKALRAKRNSAVKSLRSATGTVPTPLTETQLAHLADWNHNEMTAAIFNSSDAMKEWTLKQEKWGALHWNTVNNGFRKMALFRVGTQINMNTADEGFMALIDGTIPVRALKDYKKALTKQEISAIDSAGPEFQAQIAAMNLSPHRIWDAVKPGEKGFSDWATKRLSTFSVPSSKVCSDWYDGYLESLAKLSKNGTVKITGQMSDEACVAATKRLATMARSDPWYRDFLTETGVVPRDYYIRAIGADNIDEWATAVDQQARPMMRNGVARRHFSQGVRSVKEGELDDVKVQQAYGPVPRETHTAGVTNATSPTSKVFDSATGKMFEVSNIMSQATRAQQFWRYYSNELAFLKRSFPALGEDEMIPIARTKAYNAMKSVAYFNNRTLTEEALHNVVWFLPSYRQFFARWIPFIGKNFFKMWAIANAGSQLAKLRVPNSVPMIGGNTAFDLAAFGTFFKPYFSHDMTTYQRIRQMAPPLAGSLSSIAESGALVGNLLGATAPETFYEKISGGFKAGQGASGLPGMGQLAGPLDSLIYASTGLGSHGVLGVGPDTPAQVQKAHQRVALVTYAMIDQALASNGRSVDQKKAVDQVRLQSGAFAATKEVSPLTSSQVLPRKTYTVTPYVVTKNKNGTYAVTPGSKQKVTIDLQQMRDAAYELMSAPASQAGAVLKKYPEYAKVQKAWTLTGDARMAFLAQNPEVIPFVSRRTEANPNTTGTPTAFYVEGQRTDMTPQQLQSSIQQTYRDVQKWVLSQNYASQLAVVKSQFAKAMTAKYGKGY